MTNHISNRQIAEEIMALWQVCVLTGYRLRFQILCVGSCGVSGTGTNNIPTFYLGSIGLGCKHMSTPFGTRLLVSSAQTYVFLSHFKWLHFFANFNLIPVDRPAGYRPQTIWIPMLDAMHCFRVQQIIDVWLILFVVNCTLTLPF